MTNPFSGIISTQLKSIFNNAIDSLLEDEALTRPCLFTYATAKASECDNCYINPISGTSSNKYKPSGPIPFTKGVCPYCNGAGKITNPLTETVYLAIIANPAKFIDIGFNSHAIPQGSIQTISLISTTYQKIKNVEFITTDTDNLDYARTKYTLAGQPSFIGFGDNRYVVSIWSMMGNGV